MFSFIGGVEQQDAFDELKTALTSASVLGTVRSQGTMYLDTDASDLGLGIVLSQSRRRRTRFSTCFTNVISSRTSLQRDQKGTVGCGQYLIGHKFVIRSDHAFLQWIRRTPEPMAHAGRWLAIMEEFDFTVKHRAGSKHQMQMLCRVV